MDEELKERKALFNHLLKTVGEEYAYTHAYGMTRREFAACKKGSIGEIKYYDEKEKYPSQYWILDTLALCREEGIKAYYMWQGEHDFLPVRLDNDEILSVDDMFKKIVGMSEKEYNHGALCEKETKEEKAIRLSTIGKRLVYPERADSWESVTTRSVLEKNVGREIEWSLYIMNPLDKGNFKEALANYRVMDKTSKIAKDSLSSDVLYKVLVYSKKGPEFFEQVIGKDNLSADLVEAIRIIKESNQKFEERLNQSRSR